MIDLAAGVQVLARADKPASLEERNFRLKCWAAFHAGHGPAYDYIVEAEKAEVEQ